MTLALAHSLDDPDALWEELEGHWRRNALVGLALPQDRPLLTAAVLAEPTEPLQSDTAWGAALVLGSGGSSGGRRWCLQPLRHLQASARACGAWLADQGIDPGRCLHLDALPLHHVSGLMPLIRTRQWGAELRWMPPDLLRDPALLPRDVPLPTDRPVLLSLVPTQLHRLLEHPEAVAWLRRCTLIWVGGAALSGDLANRARSAGLPLSPCYGATETAAMICALPPERFLAGAQGCGPPLHDVELRLEGPVGSIAVRSARISPGWFARGRLHPFRDAEGWWRSGDAGRWSSGPDADRPTTAADGPPTAEPFSEARSLTIQGRLDGAIHSGGETVFPEQVRQRLLPLIQDAERPVQELLLLAETDPLWGERLVALVRLQRPPETGSAGLDEQRELSRLAALARALPAAERPGRWLSCPSLAPSESGKWRMEHWRQWLRAQPTGLD